MTELQAIEILKCEYDWVEVAVEENTFECWIEMLEEWHTVTLKDGLLWGYNERTNHKWLIN